MTGLKYSDFIIFLCNYHGISPMYDDKIKMPKDKKVLKRFVTSVAHKTRIFDGEKEHPYMISDTVRNEEVLLNAKELRVERIKSLDHVIKETGVKLKSSKVKICEGGGWYSNGTRYEFMGYYCEI